MASNPFPNLIPFRHPLPRGFKLLPDLQAGSLPVTPAIPPVVQTGDVITSAHENAVTTALGDLWTNEQWLAANGVTDPTTTKGDLIARGAALTRLPVGANGTALLADAAQATGLRWGSLDASAVGAVPITRLVIAGAGMSGGGSLSVDVTLNANVVTVFGRAGAVAASAGDYTAAQVTNAVSTIGSYADPIWLTALAWAKITGAPSFVPATRQVIAGTGLAGGGALSADVTLTALPMGASGPASHAAGMVPDPGATAGGTRYLREDATWAIPAGAGGGLTDPTTTLGDLIVRGASAPTRLGVGANGQILMADSAQPTGIKWAAAGAGAQTPWTSDIDAASHNLNNVAGIGLGMAAVANTGVIVSGAAFFDGFQQLNNSPAGWAGFTGQNDTGATFAFRIYGSGRVQANLAQLEASGAMTFVTAAAERVRITPAGNVGIGTGGTTTDGLLHVYGPTPVWGSNTISGSVGGSLLLDDSNLGAGAGGQIIFSAGNAWRMCAIRAIATNGAGFSQGDLIFSTRRLSTDAAFTEALRITAAGNVGIGTMGPGAALEVAAVAGTMTIRSTTVTNAVFALLVNGAGNLAIGQERSTGSSLMTGAAAYSSVIATSGSYPMHFGTGNILTMTLMNGHIGIGTTVPSEVLTVNGAIRLTGPIAGFGASGFSFDVDVAANASRLLSFGADPATAGGFKFVSLSSDATVLTTPLVITGGNVGAGTPNPAETLHVAGSGIALSGAIQASYYRLLPVADQTFLRLGYWVGGSFYPAGIAAINIQFSGEVGIKKAAPAYALDVEGDINASGAVRVGGVAISAGGLTTKTSPGGRVANTNYPNATGKPMFISVTGTVGAGTFMQLVTDTAATPTQIASTATNAAASGVGMTVSGWVLPGHNYRVNVTSMTLLAWYEWN